MTDQEKNAPESEEPAVDSGDKAAAEAEDAAPGAAGEPAVDSGDEAAAETKDAAAGTAGEPAADSRDEAAAETEDAAAEAADSAALEAEIADLKSRLLRALAETENVRRRAAKERGDVSKYAITAFARDLLPVVDNLRRAVDSVPDKVRKDKRLADVVAGVEMTERELLSVLDRHGVRPIDALGEKFDHNYHHAMFEIEDGNAPAGTIVKVVQVGYTLEDRLLRAAMVAIAKGPEAEPQPRVDTEA